MNNNVTELPSNFQVIIHYSLEPVEINDIVKQRIDEIWKQEIVRTKGKVFNGQILSANSLDRNEIYGHFVEYKHYIAQIRDPSLKEILTINPLCVCGYTTCGDFILIGKRSDHVTEYPNYYETVPAGGIDPSAIVNNKVEVIQQLKIELKEEAGIDTSMIQSIRPIFLILCRDTGCYEICASIELEHSVKNLVLEHDEEYTELLWIPKNEMQEFVKQNRERIVPLSLQIYHLFENK